MNKLFYPSLAVQNIRKNGRFYFPYLLSGTLSCAMFYDISFLSFNDGLKDFPGASTLQLMMVLGLIIIGIFSVIFMLYTNSFLMKKRNREIALYNILGMEKRHIGRVLTWENLFSYMICVLCGLTAGIIFSKLALMLLCKLTGFSTALTFSVSPVSLAVTVIFFLGIFILSLLANLKRIHLSSPITLLTASNAGEKEPKTKAVMAILGAIFMFAGYYIAITTENTLSALRITFLAVLLVIAGTYMLFTAGSIFVLKLLKKKKSFYYQAKNFTAVSGMLYRMKQNAVGLANICILSTMVLIMIAGTVCIYAGSEDSLKNMYATDITIHLDDNENKPAAEEKMLAVKDTLLEKYDSLSEKSFTVYSSLEFTAVFTDGQFSFDTENADLQFTHLLSMVFTTAEDYEKVSGNKISLTGNEVAIYSQKDTLPERFNLFGDEYVCAKKLDTCPRMGTNIAMITTSSYIIVSDYDVLKRLYEGNKSVYQKNASNIVTQYQLDLNGSEKDKLSYYNELYNTLSGNNGKGGIGGFGASSRQYSRQEFYFFTGGFMFIGIFIGTLLLMITVLIIYYKQISEGYDDKRRFEIMQQVGMSKAEVRKSINTQVVSVFFLPLFVAACHVAGSFLLVTRLLKLFALTNIPLFAMCTLITFLVFSVIYVTVYAITSRSYYKIVSE